MKVAKFGGSSVASAEQFRKVAGIIQSDQQRRIIVVSAPGKRYKADTKVTDLLIRLAEAVMRGNEYDSLIEAVVERYADIARGLELQASEVIEQMKADLQQKIVAYHDDHLRLLDALKASGEDHNAQLMAFYLRSLGMEARYVSPREAGIFVTDEPGNAQILQDSYEKLSKLKQCSNIVVIPGFFGYSLTGHIVTFPRGGSDITGSIVAAGAVADVYENFTDVDSIYCVNPSMVENPRQLREITYREMRELSYSGFSVFHDEALEPVYKAGIPVCVKNTNNPEAPGTWIVAKRDHRNVPVAGIASDTGFCSVNVSKYLMNREIGFGRKLLQILEDEGISYEHAPSGIDNMSVILRANQLQGEKEQRIMDRIQTELKVDEIHIEYGLALIMVVGEGMERAVGVAAKATAAFAQAQINIEMINQGSSEVSMMFGVKEEAVNKAVRALYDAYFAPVYAQKE
ncbi:aspartate kinase domain protein [Anoxybacillus sp. B7M1]|uniref:aspartate kinase n=1 Tax=unclassified Anoxybacillus TaxID=2639704 RepID=UPI0005CD307E|nr:MULTISPECIES: aspartate kinase [unclassified Anoxybacillus]ANB56896.1 aspartate kinase domain protein [Anoxybacillus sp. B2M1]ANB64091.1 aspartate kinase domain protein [Anoxybacillus sp. B7M1]